MKLEFKIYELKEDSKLYKTWVEKLGNPNEFIVVGQESENLKIQQIEETGLRLLGGLSIVETALTVDKAELKPKSDGIATDYAEFDIPKAYLTLDIIEDIQRLNAE